MGHVVGCSCSLKLLLMPLLMHMPFTPPCILYVHMLLCCSLYVASHYPMSVSFLMRSQDPTINFNVLHARLDNSRFWWSNNILGGKGRCSLVAGRCGVARIQEKKCFVTPGRLIVKVTQVVWPADLNFSITQVFADPGSISVDVSTRGTCLMQPKFSIFGWRVVTHSWPITLKNSALQSHLNIERDAHTNRHLQVLDLQIRVSHCQWLMQIWVWISWTYKPAGTDPGHPRVHLRSALAHPEQLKS